MDIHIDWKNMICWQKSRRDKTKQDQARLDKTSQHPDMTMPPGLEKYVEQAAHH